MVGREITDLYPKRQVKPAASEPLLAVRSLSIAPRRGEPDFLTDISFELRPGEVLGIGGLMGSGRTELLLHLYGAWGHRTKGEVDLRGAPYPRPAPRRSIERGLALVGEDRRRYGLMLEQSIGFNLSLSSLPQFTTRAGRIDPVAENRRNRFFFDTTRIKAPAMTVAAGSLSGGNQQKIVIGKALMTRPAVVMFDEPTRGIDVGAKLEVYELINRLCDAGKAVLLVSSELPELMGMSDRIVMLARGRIGGVFSRDDFNQETLLSAAMGREAAARPGSP
jgi:D-xylose transport system ATP-binding protein